MAKSICALVGRECPKTGDMTAKVFCPHWKENIPEHEKDGSGRVVALHLYTGCQLPKLIPYLQGNTAEVDHASVAANEARDAANRFTEQLQASENILRGALGGILGGIVLTPPAGITEGSGLHLTAKQLPPHADSMPSDRSELDS